MFNVSNNRKLFYNKNILDYCRKSTEESMQKFTEREKQKQKQKQKQNQYVDLKISNSQVVSNTSGVVFFTILSVSSFIYYFLNAKK